MKRLRLTRGLVIALGVALAPVFSSCATNPPAKESQLTGAIKLMPDGKQWTTENLSVAAPSSYCYDDAEPNCRRYGRLYTWESAQWGCRSLGDGWRLPTNDEWKAMAKHYGGVRDDSDDGGKAAFKALTSGGSSGFNAAFGGRRDDNGQYARLNAHAFYWTASESDSANGWFYNFGQARILNRHSDGEKQTALSVRCVKD